MKKGKREAENEIDNKLLSRKKHERAKVVATDDEDLPRPKKLRLIASAKHDSSSSEEEEESSSSENDTAVESNDEEESSSDGSSSEDDTAVESSSSSEENDDAVESSSNIIAAAESSDVIAAASKKEGKSTSDDHQLKKTSEQLNHSDSDKGKAIVDTCGDHEEEIHCREGEDPEPWKENETEFLIAILYAELVIHQKHVNQIDWTLIVQKLYNQTRKQTSVTQVQTLYKKFRDETNQFMDLLQVTGYEWNPNNNKVTCKDHVWEHIYWIHGGDKLFRKKGLLHYNLLRDIFSSSGSKHLVQESHVQRIVHTTPPLTSTRIWSWLFG